MRKLLLRKDVPKLGHVGDVVEVSEGYARNYLIPYNLAMEPTAANLKAIEVDKQRAEAARLERRKGMETLAASLAGVEITIAAAANEEGHLYGSVGPREIAAALRDEGHDIEAAQIHLHTSIRQLDSVMVPVVFADDLTTEIKVWVVREKASEQLDQAQAANEGEQEGADHGGSYSADESDE
jgi:large subunit ribosomal protein L9